MSQTTITPDETPVRFDLLTENPVYKPFRYPWAYEAWHTQQRVHWLPEEVPLADDVKDWHRNLSDGERNLLSQIFRFFTQADVEVNNCYMKHYSQVFKPTEVLMMLSAFSNIETIHIAAYSHLLDTVGMPELEYSAFMKYKEMKDKYDYMQSFSVENKYEIAKTLAAFGAFTEGLQLFASFAILLNFPRFGKMKGMGQIISWSVRDETLHCLSVIRLFRTFVQENPEIWTEELRRDLYLICATIVDHEDAFIDLAFELGSVQGLDAAQVKTYIRYIADRRLMQLGLNPLYHVETQPAPLARRHAERGRAHEFLREPLHRIQQGRDHRLVGGGLRRWRVRDQAAERQRPAGRIGEVWRLLADFLRMSHVAHDPLDRHRPAGGADHPLGHGLVRHARAGQPGRALLERVAVITGGADGSGVPAGLAIGGPFTLIDQSGKTVTQADFRGRWMLVYFGYTFCPDVCPTELQTIAGALDRLGPDAAKRRADLHHRRSRARHPLGACRLREIVRQAADRADGVGQRD